MTIPVIDYKIGLIIRNKNKFYLWNDIKVRSSDEQGIKKGRRKRTYIDI